MEPTAPTEAASVGVAAPSIIEPSTLMMSSSGGSKTFRQRNSSAVPFSVRSSSGRAGMAFGLKMATRMR